MAWNYRVGRWWGGFEMLGRGDSLSPIELVLIGRNHTHLRSSYHSCLLRVTHVLYSRKPKKAKTLTFSDLLCPRPPGIRETINYYSPLYSFHTRIWCHSFLKPRENRSVRFVQQAKRVWEELQVFVPRCHFENGQAEVVVDTKAAVHHRVVGRVKHLVQNLKVKISAKNNFLRYHYIAHPIICLIVFNLKTGSKNHLNEINFKGLGYLERQDSWSFWSFLPHSGH